MLGDGFNIHYNTVRFRVSLPSLAAARAALYKRDYVEEVVKAVRDGVSYLSEEFPRLGLRIWLSRTNFVLARGPPGLAGALRKHGVWVRDEEGRLGAGFVRITVGTREMNLQLVRTLKTVLRL